MSGPSSRPTIPPALEGTLDNRRTAMSRQTGPSQAEVERWTAAGGSVEEEAPKKGGKKAAAKVFVLKGAQRAGEGIAAQRGAQWRWGSRTGGAHSPVWPRSKF
jgi:hypothetical protein